MQAGYRTPTVATVVPPAERTRLDAAAHGSFATVHAETVPEVIRAVRERSVDAVLVSPAYLPRDQVPGLASLVQGFPGLPTVAVLSRHDALSSQRLLELGASGISRLVDLSGRDGWRRLRELVAEPDSPTAAKMLARIIPALESPTPGSRLFFHTLVRLAPTVGTVRALARRLDVRPSTFMSRFFRANLPSPKRYLAATRLVYASALFESRGLSIADVAYRLAYSSPQSFGRHVRASSGMTAGAYRLNRTFEEALEDFCRRLIVPYRPIFRAFHPLHHSGVRAPGQ